MNIYKFYVYAFLRKDNTPYYIGKGSGGRAFNQKRRNAPKDHSRIKILHSNLLQEDAFKLEIAYIKLYGRKDLGTGILRNLTDGGDGASGYKQSKETRKKKSKLKKSWWESEAGKIKKLELSKEFKENNPSKKGRASWNKGMICPQISQGKKNSDYIMSDENRKKVSINTKKLWKEGKFKNRKQPTSEQCAKARLGKKFPHNEKTKEKISKKKKGMKWWNNGKETKMCHDCPGNDWIRGRKF